MSLRYSPFDGSAVGAGHTPEGYRAAFPHKTWRFNPWTGTHRHERDVQTDPFGQLIRPPGKPLHAYDPVNHPRHYTSHPSGVECIQVAEHMGFNLGNAMKYLWRADEKGNAIEDLRKAAWYLQREIEKRTKQAGQALMAEQSRAHG